MREILLQHWRRYPKMEIQDLVKLIYQSEFGGGHLIKDTEESLRRLKEEYDGRQWEAGPAPAPGPALAPGAEEPRKMVGAAAGWQYREPAGYGMCRVKLAALDLGLSPETLNKMFVRSAGEVHGSNEGLLRGLDLLLELCGGGEAAREGISIPRGAVEAYIKQYRATGYPAVSHSAAYRKYYRPGYRIVNSMYGQYLEIFIRIDRLLKAKPGGTVNVAVDGMSGSGKSTLAKLLAGIYGCNVFHMDDFFLQPLQRTQRRLGEPGGNVDYERFQKQVIEHLSDERGVEYQVYDCGRQELAEKVSVSHCGLNIIEGSYSQHPYFGDCYDLRVFLEVGGQEQRERILRRNGEFMLRRFVNEWIPLENAYFEAYKIRENSCRILGLVLTNDWQML